MREELRNFAYGNDLYVYPFLADDAPDHWLGSAASIQATRYPVPAVHCNVYFERSSPLTREQWQQMFWAVERCWQWLLTEKPDGPQKPE